MKCTLLKKTENVGGGGEETLGLGEPAGLYVRLPRTGVTTVG